MKVNSDCDDSGVMPQGSLHPGKQEPAHSLWRFKYYLSNSKGRAAWAHPTAHAGSGMAETV